MDWFNSLFTGESVASVVLILSLVIATGLWLGSIRIYGVNLGIAGVLFTGLLAGHLLARGDGRIERELLEFIREFGLILFVFTVGLQVGPGFFASLRRQGLTLNLMAVSIVVAGAVIAVAINWFADVPMPAAVGMFSGATTNTPSLAAAQQAIKDVLAGQAYEQAAPLPGMAYAVAYPFGILGIILTIVLIRAFFRIDPQQELAVLQQLRAQTSAGLTTMNMEVRNPNLAGLAIKDIPTLGDSGVVISRIMHNHDVEVAQPETTLAVGDVILAVGPARKLQELLLIVGQRSTVDLREVPSEITTRRLIVTRREVLNDPIEELGFVYRHGVTITRVFRTEMELAPTPDLRLQYGDRIQVVGEPEAIEKVAREVGDSVKDLDQPRIVPIFVGIVLGVLIGSIPVTVPGVPAPVKLGLAGGPLLVAIVLSRINKIGPLIWYLPVSANYALRETGIVLFLACVGIMSGGGFLETLTQGDGLYWMLLAALITFVPILLAGLIGRIFLKTNYLTLTGVLAGSMTDPPALAFATTIAGPEAPSVAYATVYPLTMILRVLCAQLMVLVVMR